MTAPSLDCDVFVLGAGPAGLAAAAAAKEQGAKVICADMFTQPGGQYHMRPTSANSLFSNTDQVREGKVAEQHCRELGVEFLQQTEVFWADANFTILANQAGQPVVINAAAMVVATGAMERALPFKGWTLPGVITAGCAQRLIKSNDTPAGEKVVLAGTGPFLFAVANTFEQAGMKLDAYIAMQQPGLSALPLLLKHPKRIAEAFKLARGLKKTGARLYSRHQVIEAVGTTCVEAVRVAPLDADQRPIMEEAFLINDVDTLCISYGFQPIIDVTTLLHADHHFNNDLGGWVCTVDNNQATTVDGLFAAGETTGIGGAVPARLSGEIAGIQAASFAGCSVTKHPLEAKQKRLKQARRFAAGLAELFPFPAHLVEQIDTDETICRCEDVTAADVDQAIADGAVDTFSVKMWTRAGMGPCQGRICGTALAELIARKLHGSVEDCGFNRLHMPLRPVPLDVVDEAVSISLKAGKSHKYTNSQLNA